MDAIPGQKLGPGTCCGCVKSEIDAEKEPMCFLDLLCHAGPSTIHIVLLLKLLVVHLTTDTR